MTNDLLDGDDALTAWSRLQRTSRKLFRTDGVTKMMVSSVTEGGSLVTLPFQDDRSALGFFQQDFSKLEREHRTTIVLMFGKETSRSPLNISYETFRSLCVQIGIFPTFLRHITAFASDTKTLHEGHGGFASASEITSDPNISLELYAHLKYVALNHRPKSPTKWSIRKMTLYQKYGIMNRKELILLIRAPADMLSLTEKHMNGRKPADPLHWTSILMIICRTLNSNWGDYLECLERMVLALDDTTIFTDPFAVENGGSDVSSLQSTQFQNLNDSHHLKSLLIRAAHALQANLRVLKALSEEISRRDNLPGESTCERQKRTALMNAISSVEIDTQFHLNQTNLIETRIDSITALLRDCMNVRAVHHSMLESEYMHTVSDRSLIEARTVRVIAIVTLIYLPATFMATFFGMQYVHADVSGTSLTITITPELYIYLALTIPLTIMTLLAYYFWGTAPAKHRCGGFHRVWKILGVRLKSYRSLKDDEEDGSQ